MAFSGIVPLRTRLARTLMATLIAFTALTAVGLTAPADAPFSIRVRAIFLGIDVDVKVGASHVRFGWSAVPLAWATTNDPGRRL